MADVETNMWPERIWAYPEDFFGQLTDGTWVPEENTDKCKGTEYVRADLVAAERDKAYADGVRAAAKIISGAIQCEWKSEVPGAAGYVGMVASDTGAWVHKQNVHNAILALLPEPPHGP